VAGKKRNRAKARGVERRLVLGEEKGPFGETWFLGVVLRAWNLLTSRSMQVQYLFSQQYPRTRLAFCKHLVRQGR
jgi:hypothetical protein